MGHIILTANKIRFGLGFAQSNLTLPIQYQEKLFKSFTKNHYYLWLILNFL